MNRGCGERGWTGAVRVDITSHFGDERRVARSFRVLPFPIPRRCVAAYFPEANVLVPVGSVAERSNTPTSKSLHVSLALAREAPGPSPYRDPASAVGTFGAAAYW